MTRLAFLGDSLAWGQGASVEDDRLAARLVRGLAERGLRAESQVFAVPGARSAGLAAQVDRAVVWRPDVAVVIIGANDLTHLVPVEHAAADLGAAVRRLREAGTAAILAPAPDLSTVPHVPPAVRPFVQLASNELRRRQVEVATEHGARIVGHDAATTEAFRNDPSLFAADRFHPSGAGYAVIASFLLPVVIAAATP